jgi:hypothetical protein
MEKGGRKAMRKWFVICAIAGVAAMLIGVASATATSPDGASATAKNPDSYPCSQTQDGNGAKGLGGSTATCSTNNGDTQGGGSNAAPNGSGSGSTETSGPGNSSQGCNGDPSGHSDSGHGANYDGPYESVCPSGPSLNGNGKGAAVGKPCAGCVGNADDKQPKGQLPGGNDHNAGYECDRNHGIGRTNPAHTNGCVGSTTTCPAGTTMNASGQCVTVTPTCPAGTTINASGQCATVTETCPAGTTMNPSGHCVSQTSVASSGGAATSLPSSPSAPPAGGVLDTTATLTTPAPASAPASKQAGASNQAGAFIPPASNAARSATTGTLPFTGVSLWLVAAMGGAAALLGLAVRRLGADGR